MSRGRPGFCFGVCALKGKGCGVLFRMKGGAWDMCGANFPSRQSQEMRGPEQGFFHTNCLAVAKMGSGMG